MVECKELLKPIAAASVIEKMASGFSFKLIN
jgi:hypothetical protein